MGAELNAQLAKQNSKGHVKQRGEPTGRNAAGGPRVSPRRL